MDWVERYERQTIFLICSVVLWRVGVLVLRYAGVEISWFVSIAVLGLIACVWVVLQALLSTDEPKKPPPEF
jgi:hypothetical protein